MTDLSSKARECGACVGYAVVHKEGCLHAEAETLASKVLYHIDEMYPSMWDNAARSARASIRNTILRESLLVLREAVEAEREACAKLVEASQTSSERIRLARAIRARKGITGVTEFHKPGQISVNTPTCGKCGKIFLDCRCGSTGGQS